MEKAVKCHGITKSFPTGDTKILALRGVGLEVNKGELMILAGPSGCGKTTLISIVSGILEFDEGNCLVYGQNMSIMPEIERNAFRAKTIGFVFQQYNLIPTLTAAENVSIPLIICGTERQEAIGKAEEILARVGLANKIHMTPLYLSGGEQQRVAIARAIIHEPKLVVCDEPTSALDGNNGRKVMALLKELVLSVHTSMIVVTHDNRIFDFADRIATMEDGNILHVKNYTEV